MVVFILLFDSDPVCLWLSHGNIVTSVFSGTLAFQVDLLTKTAAHRMRFGNSIRLLCFCVFSAVWPTDSSIENLSTQTSSKHE